MPEFTKRDERQRGEQRDQRQRGEQRGMRRITPEHTRTHQDTPGPSRTHPASTQMLHELSEALKTQNGVTKSSTLTKGTLTPTPTPSTIHSCKPQRREQHPPRAHTQLRIARTKRNDFPVVSPHNLRSFWLLLCLKFPHSLKESFFPSSKLRIPFIVTRQVFFGHICSRMVVQ